MWFLTWRLLTLDMKYVVSSFFFFSCSPFCVYKLKLCFLRNEKQLLQEMMHNLSGTTDTLEKHGITTSSYNQGDSNIAAGHNFFDC